MAAYAPMTVTSDHAQVSWVPVRVGWGQAGVNWGVWVAFPQKPGSGPKQGQKWIPQPSAIVGEGVDARSCVWVVCGLCVGCVSVGCQLVAVLGAQPTPTDTEPTQPTADQWFPHGAPPPDCEGAESISGSGLLQFSGFGPSGPPSTCLRVLSSSFVALLVFGSVV